MKEVFVRRDRRRVFWSPRSMWRSSRVLGVVAVLLVGLTAAGTSAVEGGSAAKIVEHRRVVVAIAGVSRTAGEAALRSELETTLGVVEEWFARVSGGRFRIEFTVVPELVPTEATCDTWLTTSSAEARYWLERQGYLVDYDFPLILFPDVTRCHQVPAGVGGSRGVYLTLEGRSPTIVAHEIGHAVGLGHANAVDCWPDEQDPVAEPFTCPDLSVSGSEEYGDLDEVMGSGLLWDGLTSFHLEKLGWLEPRRVASGRFTLDVLSGLSGVRAIVVSTREREIWIDFDAWGVQFHAPISRSEQGDGYGDVARFVWFYDYPRSDGTELHLSQGSLRVGESLRLGRWLTVRVESIANRQAVVVVEWDDHDAPVFQGAAQILSWAGAPRFKWPVAVDARAGVASYRVSIDWRPVPVDALFRSVALPRLKPGKHVVRVTARDRAGNQSTLRQTIEIRSNRPPRLLGPRTTVVTVR